MYRRKHFWRDLVLRYGRKPLLLTLALVVTLSGAIGGTLAWLVDSTAPITNTFTVGDISITLTETDTNADGDSDPNTNSYEITPGSTIAKDPLVTVKNGSKDCYVYVRLEESANFGSFLTYTVADGWTPLGTAYPGVYYREYSAADGEAAYSVLKGDQVHCLPTVTKEDLGALTPATYPQLVIYAFAVQRDSTIAAISTAESAWSLHQEPTSSHTLTAVEPTTLASVDAPLTKEEQQLLAWQQFAN